MRGRYKIFKKKRALPFQTRTYLIVVGGRNPLVVVGGETPCSSLGGETPPEPPSYTYFSNARYRHLF